MAGGKDSAEAPRPSRPSGAWLGKALVVGLWSMVSRLLGLARDLGMAWLLGAGALADALVAATVVPHALRKLLGDGVLSLPVTAEACGEEARRTPFLARATLAPVLPALGTAALGLTLAALLLAPWLAGLLAPGHGGEVLWRAEAASLLRLASPYLGCAILASFAMGLLHALGEFGRAALAPVCFNLCVLAFMGLAWRGQGQPAEMIALGIAAAGMVQAILLWGFLWQAERRRFPQRILRAGGRTQEDERKARALGTRLRASLWTMPGVVLASSSLQLAVLAAMASASLAGQGRMSALYFADRLLELPVGVVGACMGIASLPELSRTARQGDMAGFGESLRLALHAGLLFSLPAAAGLWAVAPLAAGVLLGHGAFGQEGV
ncbi:MAG: murein biosynthesis protein MurJ, partial [Desulfovibrio sp.]|nr:murein biosynthesis protein MurJ [Desulfovibrio sp.]